MEHKHYIVGIYCRLSKDDISSGVSSSIQSQQALLEKYVHDNNWAVFDYYVDNGFSGTNFDRPGFLRMLDDIESGKINMVITKDLSRLGRNYILTGQYTEVYFSDRGVRFIALNDGIDTNNLESDIAPFKNILNELYSRDISRKVRSAVRAKKQRGEFLSSYAPYGYLKEPKNKNKLIIEEESAAVVRRIYEMGKSGMGGKSIAKTLTHEGVPSPSNHRAKLYQKKPAATSNRWWSETVTSILKSRIYIGDMVQGTYECSRFKRTPSQRKPPDEWYITLHTHEPIVDLLTWQQVQAIINSRKKIVRTGDLRLFAGFLKCGDCGYALSYSNSHGIAQYTCGQYRRHGRDACSSHYIRLDTLEKVVLKDIRNYAGSIIEDKGSFTKKAVLAFDRQLEKRMHALGKEMKITGTRCQELDRIMKRLYEDFVEKIISNTRFFKLSAEYELEQLKLEKALNDRNNEMNHLQKTKRESSSWAKLLMGYAGIKKLDRIVLGDLVEKITVGETRTVDGKRFVDIGIYYQFTGVVHRIEIAKPR